MLNNLKPQTKVMIELIKKLDKKHKVKFVVLYGSYARKRASKLSDIDIAIYYDGNKKERFRFRIKLLGELSNRFDIHIFQDLPLYIRNEIVEEGKILYKGDSEVLYREFIKVIREYEDFRKYINMYYNALKGAEIA